MENEKITQAVVRAIALNMKERETYDNIYSKVNSGDNITVSLEAVEGDTRKILASYVKKDGATKSIITFAKITAKGNDDFDTAFDFVKNSNVSAVTTGTDGAAIVISISEVKTINFSSGFDASIEKQRIIDMLGQDALDERVEYLKEHNIVEGSIHFKKVLDMVRENSTPVKKPIALYRNIGKEDITLVKRMLIHLMAECYPILQGPKSVGKNVAWESVAWLLNCNIVTLQCGEDMTKADMLGYQSTDIETKSYLTLDNLKKYKEALNTGVWTDAALMYELAKDRANCPDLTLTLGPVSEALIRAGKGEGTILLVDEMNLSDPNVLASVFNTLTDHHSDRIYVTGYGYINIPKTLFIGATQNGAGEAYVGVQRQNGATTSRFTCIKLTETGSITPILQREADKWNVDASILSGMNNVYTSFRELSCEGEDSVSTDSLNIRGFESAVRLVACGLSPHAAIIDGVINTVGDEDECEVLKEKVDDYTTDKGDFA